MSERPTDPNPSSCNAVLDDQVNCGPARRVGLATMDTPDDVIARILPDAASLIAPTKSIPARRASSLSATGGMRQEFEVPPKMRWCCRISSGKDHDAGETMTCETPFLFAD